MYLTDELQKKWQKVLDHPELPAVKDAHKRAVLTVLLENQETEARKERGIITEAVPANHGGLSTATTAASGTANSAVQAYDPVLISLLRRALPNLVAFDICGVQPMKAPTGLIFAMKSRYSSQSGAEALHSEAKTGHSGDGASQAADPFATDGAGVPSTGTVGAGLSSTDGEALGTGGAAGSFAEMAFSIEKVSVEAKTRALKAEYTLELAQDLRAVHGLDAETELANILSAEILAEINREVVRTVFNSAKVGAASTATAGVFDLDVDSNGRWSVEKYKGLMVQIEREANAIAKATRRGRGNILICDSDTASALSVAGLLDCGSALKDSLSVDDTGNTFVGVLNGRFKVYIDPYATKNFLVAGFKGANQYDAGLFYCPYVPLQMVRAVHQDSFQPKIGFKTRYGLVANPFASTDASGNVEAALNNSKNNYYRKIAIKNLL
jgi:Major capsid protein Gp23